MSNLLKSSFVTFSVEDKKVIKVDSSDPRILNPDSEEENKEVIEKKASLNREVEAIRQELLKEAEAEAEEIVQAAQVAAIQLKNAAATEGQKEGYDAGYFQGYEAGKEAAEALKSQIEEERLQQQSNYEALLKEVEPDYAKLLIRLIERITGVLLEDKEEIILYLINKGMASTDSAKEYVVHVSEDDYAFVLEHQEQIQGIQNPKLKIDIHSKRDLVKGQCQIETEFGLIDSSVDAQLSLLIEDFKLLAKV